LLLPRAFHALLLDTGGGTSSWFWWTAGVSFFLALAFASWDASRVLQVDDGERAPTNHFQLLFTTPVVFGAFCVAVAGLAGNEKWEWNWRIAGEIALVGAVVQLFAEFVGGVPAALRRVVSVNAVPRGAKEIAKDLLRQFGLALVGGVGGAVACVLVYAVLFAVRTHVITDSLQTTFALPIVLAALGGASIIRAGLAMRFSREEVREWWGRAAGVVAVIALAWMVLSLLVIQVPEWLLRWIATWSVWSAGAASVGGVVLTLVTTAAGFWSKSGSEIKEKAGSIGRKIGLRVMDLAALTSMLVISLALSLLLGMLMTRGEFSTASAAIDATRQLSQEREICVALSKRTAAKGESSVTDTSRCDNSVVATASAKTINNTSSSTVECTEQKPCATPPLFVVDWLVQHELSLKANRWGMVLALAAALVLVAVACSVLFGANAFSLNSFYGNRLTRAYLGASLAEKRPHPFTGFDEGDNIHLKKLAAVDPAAQGRVRLLPIVNTALNLICPSGDRLEWQERKAASFFLSPYFCGSDVLGYVSTESYASTPNGVSAGRAMSISGAAVSPSMGFHSSPLVTLLLAFFNVRLGWWMPNPRFKAVRSRDEPRVGIGPIFTELTSNAGATTRYVYLSDGGHFENLGLYEMVRRRCRHIVVVDAGCDPEYLYEDLENAVRKIRVDFGIRITFDDDKPPRPAPGAKPERHWFCGTIHYTERGAAGEDGKLFVIKPLLTGDEPLDLVRYAETTRSDGRAFPQQPTSDQFFDEAQFESYRQLGLHSVWKSFGRGSTWPTPPASGQPDAPKTPAPSETSPNQPATTEATTGGGVLSGLGSLGTWGQAALLASVTAVVTVTGTVALKDPTVELRNPQVELKDSEVHFAPNAPPLPVAVKEPLLVRTDAAPPSSNPATMVVIDMPASLRTIVLDDAAKNFDAGLLLAHLGAQLKVYLAQTEVKIRLAGFSQDDETN
ncbi:MAG TPA: hypothetical protein VJ724_15655, partial [Tahibacter sp.]|nr:hypothetical protein [Tahibacter sp.]